MIPLAFWSGKFRSGFDPYALYQTLTRGSGMMAAQHALVPREKYDVIHYVREAYLRTVSRLPTDSEMDRCRQHLHAAGNAASGMRDVLWALVNTNEFIVNH